MEIRLVRAGRARTLRLGRGLALLLLVALPLAVASCLCAALYLVFHDDLLAALIQRQNAIQYAYEDRIAALKADLDNLAGDAGRHDEPGQAVRELAMQAARLEARAAALEKIAAGADAGAPALTPAVPRGGAMETGALGTRLDTHAVTAHDLRLDAVAVRLRRAETEAAQAARRLGAPILARLARVDTALAETGLPPSRWHRPEAGLGGPFVPLTAVTSLDESIALLGEASAERDRLARIVDAIPLRRPLDGALDVTSPFGPRVDPFLGRAALHTGIDLRDEAGDAVRATAAGTVTVAGPDGGYGNLVEIDHGAGLVTRYGHLSAVEVVSGQRVAPGKIVGRVGSTGRATGPHLHYETRIDGQPVDPARFLKAAAILDPR